MIPIFFIVTGFLIDPPMFVQSLVDHFGLVCGVIGALLFGKWIAVQIAGHVFGYSRVTRWTMWSLTLPQVAATLAATLVAYGTINPAGQRLIGSELLNVVLVLMLTTSIIGPVLTERLLPRMLVEDFLRRDRGINEPAHRPRVDRLANWARVRSPGKAFSRLHLSTKLPSALTTVPSRTEVMLGSKCTM